MGKMQLEMNHCCLSRKSAVESPELLTERKKEPMGPLEPTGVGRGWEVERGLRVHVL